MTTQLQTYALTNLARLKDRLTITETTKDAALERIINGATGYIERYCNRRFARATYTNEVHNVNGRDQDYVSLRQVPIVSISSFQYRAGTPSTPSWTSFIADQYEIAGDGLAGLVRVYGGVPYGTNAIRATYIAGFLIDWDNITDITKHTLPDELSDICERIATKLWKRREAEGKTQESFESSSVTWGELIDAGDKEILDKYVRLPEFV
jgi:Phage gp6-like head-tail connector protein